MNPPRIRAFFTKRGPCRPGQFPRWNSPCKSHSGLLLFLWFSRCKDTNFFRHFQIFYRQIRNKSTIFLSATALQCYSSKTSFYFPKKYFYIYIYLYINIKFSFELFDYTFSNCSTVATVALCNMIAASSSILVAPLNYLSTKLILRTKML